MIGKSMGVHLGLFAFAGVLAWRASATDAVKPGPLEVDVWSAKPVSIKRVHYHSKTRDVELVPRKDEQGLYLIGTVVKTTDPPKKTKPTPTQHDAGATPDAADEQDAQPIQKTETFIAVKEGKALLDDLAALRALRSLGSVGADKLADFGLTGDELSTLSVEFESGTHDLMFGGRTPGGGDVYVQDKQSATVYVIKGDIKRDVELAESRLMERDLVTPPEGQTVDKVVLTHGDKSRSVVHSKAHASFWTAEDAPEEKDETITNWMNKFDRLRINEYVQGEPQGYEPLVSAVFSAPDGTVLGRVEFGQQTVEGETSPRYLARSPQTRWWGVVLTSSGSQLAQDLPSLFE